MIIWDLHSRTPRSYCRGSHYVIYSLAFSPDGMTLASGGRNEPKLWDVATGRLLLDLAPQAHTRDFVVSASFSPDGSKLALGVKAMIDVVELDNGRGIKTLRGLQALPEKVTFSTDGRLVAGLAQDWRAGVWDTTGGQLLHVFEGPTGNFADNAGLAFDPEKRRFAVSAGHGAKMWDLTTGKLLNSWSFPEGFQDTLAFHGSNKLLLFRVETKDGKALPYGLQSDPRVHPRVCRIRDLLSAKPTTPLREIDDLNWHVWHTVSAPNGDYFVSEGLGGPKGERRMVMAFDGPTGKALWTKESRLRRDSASGLRVDPSGRMIGVNLDHSGPTSIFSMPSGQLLRVLDKDADQLSPGAKGWTAGDADYSTGAPTRFSVHQNGTRLCAFSIDYDSSRNTVRFSPDDWHFSWGDASGQVYLADLVEVQRRLAAVGLGW